MEIKELELLINMAKLCGVQDIKLYVPGRDGMKGYLKEFTLDVKVNIVDSFPTNVLVIKEIL